MGGKLSGAARAQKITISLALANAFSLLDTVTVQLKPHSLMGRAYTRQRELLQNM